VHQKAVDKEDQDSDRSEARKHDCMLLGCDNVSILQICLVKLKAPSRIALDFYNGLTPQKTVRWLQVMSGAGSPGSHEELDDFLLGLLFRDFSDRHVSAQKAGRKWTNGHNGRAGKCSSNFVS
jgi:hypothetical protein